VRLGPIVLVLAGCAHASDGPLEVPLGLPRAQLPAELRPFEYCPAAERTWGPQETFAHCDTPGSDWGESWVVVEYAGDHATRVARYERYGDDARAIDRWNKLVNARAKKAAPTAEARAAVTAKHTLPPGTRSWQAFPGDHTVAAVYLLTPRPPDNASVLEEILPTEPTGSPPADPRP
jgi:hypothetical protein